MSRIESATIPDEITGAYERFCADFPNRDRVAFLMMRFGQTAAHERSVNSIRESFAAHGITVLRADDKEYHDDLFPNIKTYMHGCGLGVALFERIEDEDVNPNVSLEVGYMLAMGKPVCFLKDRTLNTLQTDLVVCHH